MHHPLLPSLSQPLSEKLRQSTDELLSRIVRANYISQFAQTASELAEFRNATAGLVDEMDDKVLSDKFWKTVSLTNYSSYEPFITRFFEKPCKARSVVDLLAPGLPDYILRSTSTSGKLPKFFPRYDICKSKAASKGSSDSHSVVDPLRKCSRTYVMYLHSEPMHIEGENGDLVKTAYMVEGGVAGSRQRWNLHPEEDRERMGTFILDHATPFAAAFIPKWRSFLLIHALFSATQRSLESITIGYTHTIVDMMRHLDTEFDVIVDCIANGTIPDWDGIEKVRHYLEMNIFPNPERAAELRRLGPPSSQPGWCGRAWPNMRSISMTSSGSFTTYTSSARWFLGPNIEIHARMYAAAEAAVIGLPYNPTESSQYKLSNTLIVEFLDFDRDDSISALARPWEVKRGRRYEIVITTQHGLWRYRLGDVVEIAGFDPISGAPVMQFVERRNMAMRLDDCTLTEEELCIAIMSMDSTTPVQIAGWTTTIDHRHSPPTAGFFVELSDGQVFDPARATEHVFDKLSQLNKLLATFVESGTFRKPTIRLVVPGTFSAFIQLKLDRSGNNLNVTRQKVPVVLSNDADIMWLSERVMQEL